VLYPLSYPGPHRGLLPHQAARRWSPPALRSQTCSYTRRAASCVSCSVKGGRGSDPYRVSRINTSTSAWVLPCSAPDNAVAQESGFRLERDRIAPTMKQKATFVLRSRGLSSSSRRAPQDATAVVDVLTAAFVRSTYERGSASTHGAPSRQEVDRLKMYVDTVLMELLETSGSTA
jgi:hypothetical protein